MNDKIKELAEQALRASVCIDGVYRPDQYSVHASKTFTDKFAELIIKECVRVADESQYKYRNFPCSIAIEKHFGVE